jgi:hypothetical protein
VAALRQALLAALEDPAQAYEALRPGGRNAIGYLGPAFSTWEEEVRMAEDAPEPQPWLDATRRLAS